MHLKGFGPLYRRASMGTSACAWLFEKNCIKNSLQKSMLGPAREALERVALNATHEV